MKKNRFSLSLPRRPALRSLPSGYARINGEGLYESRTVTTKSAFSLSSFAYPRLRRDAAFKNHATGKKSAFSLIELIVALLIGSLVSVMFYRMFSQTVAVSERMTTMVEDYSDILLFKTQIERDIAGIVVVRRDKKTGKRSAVGAEAVRAVEGVGKEQKSLVHSQEAGKDKDDHETEEPQFVAEVKEGKLVSLSLLTTNALPQVDLPGSHLVKVHYFLEADPHDKQLLQLMREETAYEGSSQQLSLPLSRPYPLIRRLSSLKVTLYVRTFTTTDKSGEATIKTVSQWGSKEKPEEVPVPEYIGIEGSYRSNDGHETIPLALLIPVPIAMSLYEKKQQEMRKKAESEQKEKAKAAQAPTAPKQPATAPALPGGAV